VVRVPTIPSYFNAARSTTSGQYYQHSIFYSADPAVRGEVARESHFGHFRDNFSEYANTENYRTAVLVKQYYISPQNSEEIPIKKNYTDTQTPSKAFVSFAGTNLNFDITLTACATPN
jgi:hypothetical protein